MANVAASSEARRAQEARAIMASNLAIYKRLQVRGAGAALQRVSWKTTGSQSRNRGHLSRVERQQTLDLFLLLPGVC